MTVRLDVLVRELPQFALGLLNTVWLCLLATALSLAVGLVLVPPLVSRRPLVRRAARLVIDGARCVPFLLLAFLVYFGLPTLGVRLDSFTAAITTLVAYNAAYMAEILRGAWVHLPEAQTETARAFGFTGLGLVRRIVLPQVLIAAGPVIGNQLIQLIKDSAFLSVITVPELTYTANAVQSVYFVPFESFALAALLYWGLCAGVERLVARGERAASAIRDA